MEQGVVYLFKGGRAHFGRRQSACCVRGLFGSSPLGLPRILQLLADHSKLALQRAPLRLKAFKFLGMPCRGSILRPRVEKLLVGRRDCSKLLDGVLKQVGFVRDLVGDVPVTGALCFVEADWPLIGGAFATRGIHVLWPKRLAKVLAEQTDGDVDVAVLREKVASRFKSS